MSLQNLKSPSHSHTSTSSADEQVELSIVKNISESTSNCLPANISFDSNFDVYESPSVSILQRKSALEIVRNDLDTPQTDDVINSTIDCMSNVNICKIKLVNSFLDDDSSNIDKPQSQIQVWASEVVLLNTILDIPSIASQTTTSTGESIYFDAVQSQSEAQSEGLSGVPSQVMEVLIQADEESKIPDRDTSEPEPIFPHDTAKPTKIKKRHHRKKWCCCCCCQKKKKEKLLNAGDSGLSNESNSDCSSTGSWTGGCFGSRDTKSARTLNCEERPNNDTEPFNPEILKVSSKSRRTRISDRPNYSLNLWSLLKNSLGKELSKIPMPVNFSEPLSMLQRLTEDYEYSEILDKAVRCDDSCEQMCYVAAFTISSYATTTVRTTKPFNALLGETYEWDRTEDLGWRCISEQVSHHPPSAALYCEGNGWICWQEFTMTSKFRGNSIEILPLGIAHLTFTKSGNHYTWRKVTTVVRNIIVGKLWVDQVGEMVIKNHTNGDKCQLAYVPYSVFNKKQKEVTGTVKTSDGSVKWVLNGSWDMKLEGVQMKSMGNKGDIKPSDSFVMSGQNVLWTRKFPPSESEKYYNFTEFAVQMNELEAEVAPTDSRLRPDQRLMEDGKWDEANAEKLRLEEKQRVARKKRGEANSQQNGAGSVDHQPAWFQKEKDLVEGTPIYTYKGEYWECKRQKDWSRCPDIF